MWKNEGWTLISFEVTSTHASGSAPVLHCVIPSSVVSVYDNIRVS